MSDLTLITNDYVKVQSVSSSFQTAKRKGYKVKQLSQCQRPDSLNVSKRSYCYTNSLKSCRVYTVKLFNMQVRSIILNVSVAYKV